MKLVLFRTSRILALLFCVLAGGFAVFAAIEAAVTGDAFFVVLAAVVLAVCLTVVFLKRREYAVVTLEDRRASSRILGREVLSLPTDALRYCRIQKSLMQKHTLLVILSTREHPYRANIESAYDPKTQLVLCVRQDEFPAVNAWLRRFVFAADTGGPDLEPHVSADNAAAGQSFEFSTDVDTAHTDGQLTAAEEAAGISGLLTAANSAGDITFEFLMGLTTRCPQGLYSHKRL